jgi:hypothetical protein
MQKRQASSGAAVIALHERKYYYVCQATYMTKPCIRKDDSDPPVCDLHNVPLVRKELSAEMVAAGYKDFTFLVCPVRGAVVD